MSRRQPPTVYLHLPPPVPDDDADLLAECDRLRCADRDRHARQDADTYQD